MALSVGLDLVGVDEVREAVATHGRHYLDRVYTADEQADCAGEPLRLAARFAAKEAAVKALRPEGHAVPWLDVEVRRDPAGWTELLLHRRAAELARERHVTSTTLSITHERNSAAAVVVIEMERTVRQEDR